MRCGNVVIADRHPVVLQSLISLLGVGSGFKVVASCSNGTTCMEAIRKLVADIAIFDISMPGLIGLEILDIACAESLPTRLVVFASAIHDCELESYNSHGVPCPTPLGLGRGELCPIMEGEMHLDGALGNIQPTPNFLVGQSFRYQTHYLALSVRQHRLHVLRERDALTRPGHNLIVI